MTNVPAPGSTEAKLAQWVDKVLKQIQELVKSRKDARSAGAEYFRLDQEEIAPILPILSSDEQYAAASEHLRELRAALEALILSPAKDAKGRKQQLSTIYRSGTALRNELKPAGRDEEPVLETKLRDLAWRTRMDDEGHVLFDAGGGLVVPIRGDIRELARPQIIAQAIRQQPAYPDVMRPRNVRDLPGSMLNITKAKRLLAVGDLHGRYDNLELVLADKDNWRALKDGSAHLLFLGDAIHPRTAESDQDAANADSFRVLFLILSLQAENPGCVHYLIGNHENAHIGGLGAGKGDRDVEEAFTAFIQGSFGPVVLETYEKFLDGSPIVARIKMADGHLIAVHASLSPLVRNQRGLINLTVKGRRGKAMTDMLWSRNFGIRSLVTCLRAVGAGLAVCGHTNPTKEGARKYGFTCMLEPAFGHVHGKQLIVSSQSNTLGYLDIDLTRNVPQSVEDLRSPDGKYAFRVLRRRG